MNNMPRIRGVFLEMGCKFFGLNRIYEYRQFLQKSLESFSTENLLEGH